MPLITMPLLVILIVSSIGCEPKKTADSVDPLPAVVSSSTSAEVPQGDDFYHDGKDAFNQKDYATALEQFMKAAESGHAKAHNWIGWMYYYGKGVPQNNQEALNWYTKSAEGSYAIAQVNLGKMYELGRGVLPDAIQAYKWYTLAVADVSIQETRDRVIERRDELAQKMSQQEIAEANRLAREWTPTR
ncbi:MAG: hypothetical protein CMH81_00125 [Nitrospiraceae bacterium]|nr:hypothetical protein [Nitrospiraceae bacterium]